jgi:hypothetical protein
VTYFAALSAVLANIGEAVQPDPAAPVITGEPTISGTVRVGSTLTASSASVTGFPVPARTWQWTRDGSDISGATSATYTLALADVGALIRVRQVETNSEGSDTATSDPVARMIYSDDFGTDTSSEWSLGEEAVDGAISVTGGKLRYTKGAGDSLRPRIVRAISVTALANYRVEIPAATGTAPRRETWVSTGENGSFGGAVTTITNNTALSETFEAPQAALYIVMRAGTDSVEGDTVEIDHVTVLED